MYTAPSELITVATSGTEVPCPTVPQAMAAGAGVSRSSACVSVSA